MSVFRRKWVIMGLIGTGVLFLILLIPDRTPAPPEVRESGAFLWDRDAYWSALEADYRRARSLGCEALADGIDQNLAALRRQVKTLNAGPYPVDAAILGELETNLFRAAPMVAVCMERLPEFLGVYARMRSAVKRQSIHWPVQDPAVRERLYRLLYGGRAAVEEVMLQVPREQLQPLLAGEEEPSATPAAEVQGVTLHSGDILVSRGGAATSALIARGNDFPGNFSHVALVYVDSKSKAVSLIESHIECGVTVSTLEKYLADTKLRIMVLRLRSDLVQADPMLPHRAAETALQEAVQHPVPYDFAMDQNDPSKKFCCEVASWAYRPLGVQLWSIGTRLSSRGTTAWLSCLGVQHFETQEPADLEYDPQLTVVAEWRDPDTLFKDHVHNAIIDVMLEGAEGGEALGYAWSRLPLARCAKAYSVVLNWMGKVGPIPEGMSATTALRVQWMTARHAAMETSVLKGVEEFRQEQGYVPPYWELIRLAREAARGETKEFRTKEF